MRNNEFGSRGRSCFWPCSLDVLSLCSDCSICSRKARPCLPADSGAAQELLTRAEEAVLLRRQLQETSSHTLAIMDATSRQRLPQLGGVPGPAAAPSTSQTLAHDAGHSGQNVAAGEGSGNEQLGLGREAGESSHVEGGDRAMYRGLSFPDMPWDADLSEMDKVRSEKIWLTYSLSWWFLGDIEPSWLTLYPAFLTPPAVISCEGESDDLVLSCGRH